MPYKEYHRYIGKVNRSDAALCTDILEVKRRKKQHKHGVNSDALARCLLMMFLIQTR